MTAAKATRKRDKTMIRMERDHYVIKTTFEDMEGIRFVSEDFQEYLTMYMIQFGTKKIWFHMCRRSDVHWFSLEVSTEEDTEHNAYVGFDHVQDIIRIVKYLIAIYRGKR